MKKYAFIFAITIFCATSSYAQNTVIKAPIVVGHRIANASQTFVGYGATPSQSIANIGGIPAGRVVSESNPIQIANNVWMSRRVVVLPTVMPVYSAKSVDAFLKSANISTINTKK